MKRAALLLSVAFVVVGCAEPKPITIYKDVLVPVKCPVAMPDRPHYDGTFESAKAKRIYWGEVEELLRQCVEEE